MEPTKKELEAIKASEQFFQKRNKNLLSRLINKVFSFDDYKTDKVKSLEVLWSKFGLNNDKYKFSDEEKVELIHRWFNILYPFNRDIITSYNRELEHFQKQARKFYQENPHMHVSWNYPSPEKYLSKLTKKFGHYDNPKFEKLAKVEIDDSELFRMGIHYIREKLLRENFEIIQYQEPPFVPQFILEKNNKIYFLYTKVKRHPFELKEIFTDDEIQGYVGSCQKRNVNLLLAGIVFSNGIESENPIFKEDKIGIDFTGIINLFE